MKNIITRCLFLIVALFCVVGCSKQTDLVNSFEAKIDKEQTVEETESTSSGNEVVSEPLKTTVDTTNSDVSESINSVSQTQSVTSETTTSKATSSKQTSKQNVDSSSTKTSNVTSSSVTQKKNTSSKAITSKTTTSKKSTSQKADSSKKTTSNKNTSSSKKSSSSKKTTSSTKKTSSSGRRTSVGDNGVVCLIEEGKNGPRYIYGYNSWEEYDEASKKWTGDVTDLDPSWKCPDPSVHGGGECLNALDHERGIKVYKEEQARYEKWAKKWGFTDIEKFKKWMETHCRHCGRLKGDGYNGTCFSGLEDSRLVCLHYDENNKLITEYFD